MKKEIRIEEAMEMAFDLLEETNQVKYTKVWTRRRMVNAILESNTSETSKFYRYMKEKLSGGRTWKIHLLSMIGYKQCSVCSKILNEEILAKTLVDVRIVIERKQKSIEKK